jgi:acetylornithine deacetylase/succinyl-diaminopimelate desuccinylase-like protein
MTDKSTYHYNVDFQGTRRQITFLLHKGALMRNIILIVVAGITIALASGCNSTRSLAPSVPAQAAAAPHTSQQLAHDIYRELIEINTVTASGDTGKAADAMAARLRAAGLPAADVQVFKPLPRKGNLVARLRGTGLRKPILLMAHLDVVEALRTDWSFDPFKLTETDGFFYGRGTTDDKYNVAGFVSTLIRLKQEGYRPDRDIVLLLETDEETGDENTAGMTWMLKNHRDLLDAEYALNEGGGLWMKEGRPFDMGFQTCEKIYQSYWLEVRNRGGHASMPTKDNAIYRLAAGLTRLAQFDFPVQLNETTRAYFERMATVEKGQMAADMKAVTLANPDPAAVARLSAIPLYNAQLRTTCVATRVEAGHADNALPQTARAMVNCRVLPGESVDAVRETIVRVLEDDQISVTPAEKTMLGPPSPLNPDLLRIVEKLTEEFWPGTPVIPTMETGATDGLYLRNAGIPTYGVDGFGTDMLDVRAHGKDERMPVKSFYDGVEFSYRLVKALTGGA